MQPDALSQLRDLHLPTDPVWWPPAPGWWLLALLGIIAIAYLIRLLRQELLRRRPIKRARQLYQQLYVDYQKGLMDGPAYLHQANELLKRLLIHGLKEDRARAANDAQWLALLDEKSGTALFTEGPGRQLGNDRFRVHPEADPERLHPVLDQLFRKVRP